MSKRVKAVEMWAVMRDGALCYRYLLEDDQFLPMIYDSRAEARLFGGRSNDVVKVRITPVRKRKGRK